MSTLLIKGVKAKTTTLASCSLLEGFLGPERERERRAIIICHTKQAGRSWGNLICESKKEFVPNVIITSNFFFSVEHAGHMVTDLRESLHTVKKNDSHGKIAAAAARRSVIYIIPIFEAAFSPSWTTVSTWDRNPLSFSHTHTHIHTPQEPKWGTSPNINNKEALLLCFFFFLPFKKQSQ